MFPVAREGRRLILLTAVLATAVTYEFGFSMASPLWLVLLLMIFFLRDFARAVPALPLGNVSPVDGTVINAELAFDPFLKREALRVRIKQHGLGEFSVHSPIEGKVQQQWRPRATTEDAQIPPQYFAVWIRTDEDDDTVMAVDLRQRLHFIQCAIQSGERIGQGRRCGLIGFGVPVDLYFPANARLNVQAGQQVRAGSDVIATFIHN